MLTVCVDVWWRQSGDAGGPSQSKMTYLCFNATEEPTDILQRYMKTYDIPAVPAYVQQLQNKILQVGSGAANWAHALWDNG